MMVAVGIVWFGEPSDQVAVTVTFFVLTSGLSFATVTCLVYVRPEAVTWVEGCATMFAQVVFLIVSIFCSAIVMALINLCDELPLFKVTVWRWARANTAMDRTSSASITSMKL